MKASGLLFSLLAGSLLFTSCEKEEPLITLPPPGEAVYTHVSMGENYETQFYFELGSNSYQSSDFRIWDLAFSAVTGKPYIRLNGGKDVQVYNTGKTDFSYVPPETNVTWQWDNPNGNTDSTAFGALVNQGNVPHMQLYMIDLGKDATPRYKKLVVEEINPASYTIRFANPDGSEEKTFIIPVDTTRNYTYFSFNDNGRLVNPEPDKSGWDLLFTRYRHIYYDMTPIFPYQVTGVLINPAGVEVYTEKSKPFAEITYDYVKDKVFGRQENAIGYDWKTYDMNSSNYVVNKDIIYIIKDTKGIYYKLHFLDFYDDQGVKGTPKFEFQRL